MDDRDGPVTTGRNRREVALLRPYHCEMSGGCPLCAAAVITTRYFDDELCWIADCEICLVPMVVWRQHDAIPPPEIKHALLEALRAVADSELGPGEWRVDDHMRNIPDHYHAHARPPSFWRRNES